MERAVFPRRRIGSDSLKRARGRGRPSTSVAAWAISCLPVVDAAGDVEGMDISADSAAYVRDELKIPVAVGTIDGVDYPAGIVRYHHDVAFPRTCTRAINISRRPGGG